MKTPSREPSDFHVAHGAEATLQEPEKAKCSRTPKRFRHMIAFAFFEVGLPSSGTTLRSPRPLRTVRDGFPITRLKPFERLFQGDAAPVRKDVGGEPGRGTLDEAERGCLRLRNHLSHEGRDSADASP